MPHRRRLVTLAVLGALLSLALVRRRQALAKHAAEFHQRYG